MLMATKRIEERKSRDRQARRAQIVAAARTIAELEGWPAVTVRRLSDEISYSQPVLYSHFESRDGIIAAIALEGFQELGVALSKALQRGKQENHLADVANAYMKFAAEAPALYEAMFSLDIDVLFGDAAVSPELRFAFAQMLPLFSEQDAKAKVLAELFWANLHGVAQLTRTKRFPPKQQKERLRSLVRLFNLWPIGGSAPPPRVSE